MRRAHELAFWGVKRPLAGSPVCLSHHKFLLLPAPPSRLDRFAASTAQLAMDRWPVAPGLLRKVVEATCDFIGIAHYWGQGVVFDPLRPKDQFIKRFNVPGVPVTDMGWGTDPTGVRRGLHELNRPGKPVDVTEDGLARHDHEWR